MKNVLVIAYYFGEANMGGIRVWRIVRHLREYGLYPIVIAGDVSHECLRGSDDYELVLAEAPKAENILKRLKRYVSWLRGGRGQREASGLARKIGLTSFVNRWFMVPDKQVLWYRSACRAIDHIVAGRKIDVIFSSLEPRTDLLVAAYAKKKWKIPCLMEYRDLWTGNPYYHLGLPTALHRTIHKNLERYAIRHADALSCVSKGIQGYLQSQYDELIKRPVSLHYNFYDQEEYPAGVERNTEPFFVLSYVGAMYASRQPAVFFQGLREFIDQHNCSPGDFRFKWYGGVFGIEGLDQLIEDLRLSAYIDYIGKVCHRDALVAVYQSDAVLVLQSPDDRIHIPGKVFEAMGAKTPILLLANECEVAEIVEKTHSGLRSDYKPEHIAKALNHLWMDKKAGRVWLHNDKQIARYSVDVILHKLSSSLKSLCVER